MEQAQVVASLVIMAALILGTVEGKVKTRPAIRPQPQQDPQKVDEGDTPYGFSRSSTAKPGMRAFRANQVSKAMVLAMREEVWQTVDEEPWKCGQEEGVQKPRLEKPNRVKRKSCMSFSQVCRARKGRNQRGKLRRKVIPRRSGRSVMPTQQQSDETSRSGPGRTLDLETQKRQSQSIQRSSQDRWNRSLWDEGWIVREHHKLRKMPFTQCIEVRPWMQAPLRFTESPAW